MKIKFEIFGDISIAGAGGIIHLRAVQPLPAGCPLFGAGGEFVLPVKASVEEKLAAKLAAGEKFVEMDFPQFD